MVFYRCSILTTIISYQPPCNDHSITIQFINCKIIHEKTFGDKHSFYFPGRLYDNALVIHDYSGFDIFINNERYTTNVGADDGKWHHIALSWTSLSGEVVFYKDGSPVSQGTIQKSKVRY